MIVVGWWCLWYLFLQDYKVVNDMLNFCWEAQLKLTNPEAYTKLQQFNKDQREQKRRKQLFTLHRSGHLSQQRRVEVLQHLRIQMQLPLQPSSHVSAPPRTTAAIRALYPLHFMGIRIDESYMK